MEEWKTLERWPGYVVSNTGKVKSVKKGKDIILKQSSTQQGYGILCLYSRGKRHTCYVHRLVAEAFLPLKPHLRIENAVVNHKDKNPTNNRVENLEWVSLSENLFHKNDPETYFIVDEIKELVKSMNLPQLKKFVELGKTIVQ